jgi:hypothetical protein
MRRNAVSIWVALAVHAGGLVVLTRVHVPKSEPPPEPQTLEIDVQGVWVEDPATAAPTPTAGVAGVAGGESKHVFAAVATGASRNAARPDSTRGKPPESVDTRPPSDPTWSIWDAVSTGPSMNLRLPAVSAGGATTPPSGETEPAPAPVSTTGGLREGLAAHDRELGLGPGGPVVGVAESATRASVAPVEGFALFEVRFDETGAVHDVRVVDAKNEASSWADVASGIAAGLKATHVHVPSGAHGVSVKVRVESAWLYADGSRPGPIAVCVPPVPCNPDPKVKRVIITPLMIAGNIVPDAPVAPSRHVHARIVDEQAY